MCENYIVKILTREPNSYLFLYLFMLITLVGFM